MEGGDVRSPLPLEAQTPMKGWNTLHGRGADSRQSPTDTAKMMFNKSYNRYKEADSSIEKAFENGKYKDGDEIEINFNDPYKDDIDIL